MAHAKTQFCNFQEIRCAQNTCNSNFAIKKKKTEIENSQGDISL